jgi:probable F420-dependent oxidoreductase
LGLQAPSAAACDEAGAEPGQEGEGSAVKVTFHIPMDIDDRSEFQNGAAIREMAQALERYGADACYITDHPAPTAKWRQGGGHDALDPFTGLAFVAAATSRMRLHTNLIVLPYRNPFVTAKAVTTLDVVSDGRVILGIGVGYLRGEYHALGADFEGRGAVMDEALETMQAVWTQETVSREGRRFAATDVFARPLPVQKPHPPIWHGGNSERAIRRAAKYCNGWSPFFAAGAFSKATRTDEIANLDDLKFKIGQLREELDKAGRTGPFDISIGPQQGLQGRSPADIDRYIQAVGEMAELGSTWMGADPPHPDRATWLENLQWYGEEVLPKIHAVSTPGIR